MQKGIIFFQSHENNFSNFCIFAREFQTYIMRTKSRRLALVALKYAPILGAFIMVIHIGFLLVGIDLNLADNIATMQTIPAITLFLVSHTFGFCWLHKSFTIYDLMVSLCIDYQRDIGFAYSLMEHRTMAIILGIILFSLLFYKRTSFINTCCKYDNEDVEQELA